MEQSYRRRSYLGKRRSTKGRVLRNLFQSLRISKARFILMGGTFVTPCFHKILKLVKIMHVTNLAAGKFSNNLIGCISWRACFYFLALGQFRFSKRVKTVLNSCFNLFYLSFVQKPWFKFKYLNQFPKLPDLKSPQKVYFSLC
jgi:hypothetical protein